MTAIALEVATRAACSDRLDLVDAAFAHPGSASAHHFRDAYCAHCPIAEACLFAGIGEWGLWGGTSPSWRTKHAGAPTRNSRRIPPEET
jgi:hypothetical protein